MHETHLIDNILKYLESEESKTRRKIKKIHVTLSEFGGISPEHFIGHYQEAVCGTRWSKVEIKINKVAYGSELAINRIDFS